MSEKLVEALKIAESGLQAAVHAVMYDSRRDFIANCLASVREALADDRRIEERDSILASGV